MPVRQFYISGLFNVQNIKYDKALSLQVYLVIINDTIVYLPVHVSIEDCPYPRDTLKQFDSTFKAARPLYNVPIITYNNNDQSIIK